MGLSITENAMESSEHAKPQLLTHTKEELFLVQENLYKVASATDPTSGHTQISKYTVDSEHLIQGIVAT